MYQLVLGIIIQDVERDFICTTGNETVPDKYVWSDLISCDNFKNLLYNKIYVYDDNLFKTKSGKFLNKRVHRFLDRLINKGELYIKDDTLSEFRMPKHFKYIDTLNIDLDQGNNLFRKYIKNGSSIEKDTVKKLNIGGKPKSLKLKKSVYTRKDYVFLDGLSLDNNNLEDCSITFDKFKEILYSQNFIIDFYSNLIKLFDDKIKKYEDIIEQLDRINNIQKNKLDIIKDLYDNDKKVNDIFSEHLSNILIKVHINTVINTLKELKDSFTIDDLKISLEYSFLDCEEGLNSLIGMDDIKDTISELFYGFSRNYKIFTDNFINFCITGNPGSGKTFLSERIGKVFTLNKIFVGDIKKLSRADLVGMYVGHTSKEVKNLLFNNIEGVVIVDEAYSLVPKSEKDFSSETISEIVNFMDKYICCQCLIFIGYHEQMTNNFLKYNEGMKRRIPFLYHCNDYTSRDLTYMCVMTLEKRLDETLGSYLENVLYTYIVRNYNLFSNQMGDILNLSQIIFSKMLVFGINEISIIKAFSLFQKNDKF